MKRTYLDASVLIAAFRGNDMLSRRAMAILDDPGRQLVVSDYVRLEVLPKPTFLKRSEEVEFMRAVLDSAEDIVSTRELTGKALEFASAHDMTPVDALHVGAAVVAQVDELVTLESPNKPMCKVREIPVRSLHSASRPGS